MASSARKDMKLTDIFDSIWKNYQFLEETEESTVSKIVQDKVKDTLDKSEQAIHMINELSLFSTNEDIEEIATNELRYMLLPALLGYASLKNTKIDRLDAVKKSQDAYKEYLRLVKLYCVTNLEIPGSQNGTANTRASDSKTGMMDQAQKRKIKLERFREQKEIQKRLKELHVAVNREHVDEDVKRDYYMTLLKQWINIGIEDLETIQDELQILEHMAKMKKQGGASVCDKPQPVSRKPMAPFILTRDRLQAAVIGAGYPSLPTYTLEEFHQQQCKDLQPTANGSAHQNGPADSEEDEVDKEKKLENDDPETLRQAREMDDFKDDHRRGWGNRANRS